MRLCVTILSGLVFLALTQLAVSSAATTSFAGDLDPSFGAGGVLVHSLGEGQGAGVGGVAVQPDGKIVVAGGSTGTFLLARYLPNGSPDPSFGDGGYVQTHFPDWALPRAVALQPDGKIVLAGASVPVPVDVNGVEVTSQFTLARYNPNGSLDTSFGTDGITTTIIPEPERTGWSADANAVAILPNGEILAAGSAGYDAFPPLSSFALVRYTPDGSLDPSFGEGGIVQTAFSGYDYLSGIVVQPDGKVVATGTSFGPGHGIDFETMALARYESDGSLDHTFGTAGKVTTAHKLRYSGGPSTLQHGEILVAGYTRVNGVSNDFPVIARYTASGRLDSTFGERGFAEITRVNGDSTHEGIPNVVLAQNDGKILIGAANSVARLLPNGRLDTSFGRRGIVSFGNQVSRLALQTDGKILVGGGLGNAWTLDRLSGGNNCVVPGLRGKTVSKARAMLKNSYCRSGHISTRFSTQVRRGRVISTVSPRGTRLFGGTSVPLIVSRGRQPHHRS